MDVTVVIPTLLGGPRLYRLLDCLRVQTIDHQVIVVDNGWGERLDESYPEVDVLALDHNAGFGRAVNMGAKRADGDSLVFLNDDATCEPDFVEALTKVLDPASGVVMGASVLRTPETPDLIDTAGMELDSTLLPFDYLNGRSLTALMDATDPIGPSAAAAAFDHDAFLDAGGFDERLFAYWEDVDLVLRMRLLGGRCALARTALGTHEHSATLGSGSRAKNYLMGFGRAYILRKWRVLGGRRWPQVLLRDLPLCLGQALVDRNTGGIRGRFDGFRAGSVDYYAYPEELLGTWERPTAAGTLVRRARRRARLSKRDERVAV